MAIYASQLGFATESRMMSATFCEPHWYAAYTSANHEKRVSEQLMVRSIDHFLPMYSSIRRWKDRRVTLQLPLFPGYVFVRLALRDKLQVQQVPGVARLVEFDGAPAALPDEEIEALKQLVASGIPAEPHPYLMVGRRTRICAGPLNGFEGIVVRRKGRLRVVLSVDIVQRSVMVDVDLGGLELM